MKLAYPFLRFCFHWPLFLLISLLSTFNLFAQPLSGIYTLGGANPDFASFAGAISSLTTNGVTGAVTFNVRSGYYYEQVSIPEITGASAVNTVTFQSETSDSTSVILLYPTSPISANNFTLQLNGADHFIFREMTFARTDGYNFSTVVELANEANHNQFLNNRFEGTEVVSGPNLNGSRSGVFSEFDSNQNYNIFRHNHFKDNANGIHMQGQALGPKSVGNIIEENIVETYYYGINLVYHDGPVIRNNYIARAAAATFPEFNGVSIRYSVGALEVTGNQVIGRNGQIGIRLTTCNGNGTPGLVANNFVQVSDNGRGILLEYGCNEQRIYYNSVNVTGSSTTSSAFQIAPSAGTNFSGIELVNNNLVNAAGGYAIYVPYQLLSSLSFSDYNNLFTTGTTFGFYGVSMSTFAAWKATTPYDDHSVSVNPGYVSPTDLHTGSAILNGAALPLTAITLDFDTQARNATSPDIGADEFTPPQPDASVTLQSGLSPVCVGTSVVLTATIVNSGNTTLTNIPVSVQYSGPAGGNVATVVAGPVAPAQSAAAVFPGLSFTVAGTYTITISASVIGDTNLLNDTALSTLTVLAPPQITVFSDTSLCKGQSANLTATGADFYSWSPPPGLAATTGAIVAAGPLGTTTYTVTGTTAAGCSGSGLVTVTINPTPLMEVTPLFTSICPGDTAILTALGALSYSWATGENTQHISVSPSSSATYLVIGTTGQGCTGSATAIVQVLAAPVFSLGNDTTITSGTTLTLTAQTGGVYLWQDNSTAQTFAVTQPGTYVVTVTNAVGCSATDSVTVSVISAMAPDVSDLVGLYPNPVHDLVTITLTNPPESGPAQAGLTDLSGKRLRHYTLHEPTETTLNLAGLPAGSYLLSVYLPNGQVKVFRLIKQ